MSDQQCREVFEKCAKDEGFILKKHDREYWYGNTGTAWRMWQASWNSRPSFVVPSEETIRRLIMTEFIRAEEGADLSALAYVQATAIHSHLLASGDRESVAWEALERIVRWRDTEGSIVLLAEVIQQARTALATQKEGA